MSAFMASDAYVRVLAGPIGAGKSVCCAHELVHWAASQQPNGEGIRKTRFLVVRNTADQLKSTTMKTVFDWFPPAVWGEYKVSDKTFYVRFALSDGTVVQSEWMFIALDTPDDIRKALSLEATGLWGNEARELHPEVVDGLLSRVNRYPSMREGGATRAGGIFDTNMPDVESWWHKKMEEPPKNWTIHVQPPAIITADEYRLRFLEDPPESRSAEAFDGTLYVANPAADNYANLNAAYYPNNIPGKTQDFLDVYLRCRYGRSLSGTPVYEKTFIPDFHIAKDALKPIKSEAYPVVMGLDFGRTPAAVFGQLDPRGRMLVFSELTSMNMGIEKFLATEVKPHIYAKYAGYPIIVAPDPAGWAKTQVGELSPVDVLRQEGFRIGKPGSNKIDPRIRAVERQLTRQIDGGPAFLIDPACQKLIQGFKYGYRWKIQRNGSMVENEPDKNDYSHCHDAMQYLCLVADQGAMGGLVGSERREVVTARNWA